MAARKNIGFSLIEVMIVVAILAIVAVIAVPAYQQHVIDSRRAQAGACLLQLAQRMERLRTTSASLDYDVDLDGSGTAEGTSEDVQGLGLQCIQDLDGDYTFSLAALTASNQNFRLEANPQGNQDSDDNYGCGTLGIDQAGNKSSSGSLQSCWQ